MSFRKIIHDFGKCKAIIMSISKFYNKKAFSSIKYECVRTHPSAKKREL